jgi:predicted TIM-barrel fold metal-dependent hydrolase
LSRAAEPLRAVQPAVRRKILSTNAATLYRIPVPDTTA